MRRLWAQVGQNVIGLRSFGGPGRLRLARKASSWYQAGVQRPLSTSHAFPAGRRMAPAVAFQEIACASSAARWGKDRVAAQRSMAATS